MKKKEVLGVPVPKKSQAGIVPGAVHDALRGRNPLARRFGRR